MSTTAMASLPPTPDIASLIPEPPVKSICYWDDEGVYIFCPENGRLLFFVSVRHGDRQLHVRAWVQARAWTTTHRSVFASIPCDDPDFKAVYRDLMLAHPSLRGVGYLPMTGRWEWEVLCD